MAQKRKNYHIGGQQMPLIVPDTAWKRLDTLPDLRRCGVVALDRETKDDGLAQGRGPGWAYGAGYVTGTSVAWKEGGEYRAFYAPIRHPDSECFDEDAIRRWEIDHQKAGVRFVMFNAGYDVGWGDQQWGIPCPEKLEDVSCMAFMIDETRLASEYSLDEICKWRGLPGKDERLLREAARAYGVDPKTEMYKLPARFCGQYAEADAMRTLQLLDDMQPEIDEQELNEAYRLEIDIIPLIHAMRKRGIRVDLDAAERAQKQCFSTARTAFDDLSVKLKTKVSIDEIRSNEWLDRAFSELKLRVPRDEYGKASFDAKWMKNDPHWLPQLLVRAKSYYEAADKFIGNYIMGYAHNGRLHASINQFKTEEGGTRTFRFSYSDPPLQQMPARNEELADLIRGIFLPEEGELWLGADYSQQEYRLIVHFAEKLDLPRAREAGEKYRNDPNTDFHSMVAEMTGLARKPAKDTNFAKSYGAGVKKFAQMINQPVEKAEEIMNQYDREMPFVKRLNEILQGKAERTGFIRLIDGARIHFNQWEPAYLSKEERSRGWGSGGKYRMNKCDHEEAMRRVDNENHPWYGKRLRRADCRKAMNGRVQGSAARQTKLAMRTCWKAGLVPLLQLHDELDFSVSSKAQVDQVVDVMVNVFKLLVPMKVDAEVGENWGKAKQTWEEFHEKQKAAKRTIVAKDVPVRKENRTAVLAGKKTRSKI